MMLFCFSNISAEILLHILGHYNLCTECHILARFCQMFLAAIESIKIICKRVFCFGAKNVGDFDPSVFSRSIDDEQESFFWHKTPVADVIKLFTAVSYNFP